MISMAAFTIGPILRFKTTSDYSKNPNWHKGAPGKWFRAKRKMPAAAPGKTPETAPRYESFHRDGIGSLTEVAAVTFPVVSAVKLREYSAWLVLVPNSTI